MPMIYSHTTLSIARCTLHNGPINGGLMGNRLRKTLVEQVHDVWWIFDSTSCEIESPDLHVEDCVTHQKVLQHSLRASVGHGDDLAAVGMLVPYARAQVPLLFNTASATDHIVRSRQSSHRFPRIMFVKRQVTPPDEELSTMLARVAFRHLAPTPYPHILLHLLQNCHQRECRA